MYIITNFYILYVYVIDYDNSIGETKLIVYYVIKLNNIR